jgi:hypothetical protein
MPDNSAAAAFWGAMLFLAVAFWPLWALRGPARAIVSAAWFGIIAAGAIWFLAALTAARRRQRGVRR